MTPGPLAPPTRALASWFPFRSLVSGRSARAALAALVPTLVLGLVAERADAACDPDTPPLADGGSVTCSGTDETGFDATGFTDLTITTSGTAELDDSSALDAAIRVSDGNTVTIGADATITVVDDLGAGVRGGDDNFVTNDGTIVVDGANAVAIDVGSVIADDQGDADPTNDVDPVPTPTITNAGTIRLNGVGSIGLRSVDNFDVENASTGVITIESTATGGIGIFGANDNIVRQNGQITLDAGGAWGVRIFDNTGLPLPNGAIFGAGSTTVVNGAGSRALEVGNNVGTLVSGAIELVGDDTRGVVIGDRSDPMIPANHTNTGTIDVDGANAIGLEFGDGWIAYSDDGMGTLTPSAAGVRNPGRIDVRGNGAIGVFGGEDASFSNYSGNDPGVIDVVGSDAVGVSLGGNDLFDRWDFDDPSANVLAYSYDATGGALTGGPDAGPLLLFRDATPGRENRVLIGQSGSIVADLTNLGTPDRGVAIRGSNGDEMIFHLGALQGDVQLGGGDDRYLVNASATYTGGTIDGGAGNDEVILGFVSGAVAAFDAANIGAFERIRVDGRDVFSGDPIGWRIDNGNLLDPTSEVFVAPDGRLSAAASSGGGPTTMRLGGDLRVDPAGSVFVVANPDEPAITVGGDATFDGTVEVSLGGSGLTNGSVRLIQVDGTRTGTFATENLPGSLGTVVFTTTYDANGLLLDIMRTGTFAVVASSASTRAIAAHLDAIFDDGTGDGTLNDLLLEYAAGTDVLDPFFASLSPEAYDAQTTVAVESGRRLASLLFDRPRDCVPGRLDPWTASRKVLPCHGRRLSAWATGLGTFRERDAYAGHPEYEATLGGAVLGIDWLPREDVELTLAIGGQSGTVDVTGRGESDLTLVDVVAQAAWAPGPLRLQGAFGYGHGFHDASRRGRFDATGTDLAFTGEDRFESRRVTLAAQAGYRFDVGPFGVEPTVGADWVWIDQDESEEDGGPFSAIVASRDDQVVSATAGVTLSSVYHHTKYLHTNLEWIDGVWRPSVALRWRQYLTGFERSVEARLVGAPDTVGGFEIDADEDAGGFEVEAGLSFVPKHANRFQIDLRYDLYRAAHTLEHDLVAKLRIGF